MDVRKLRLRIYYADLPKNLKCMAQSFHRFSRWNSPLKNLFHMLFDMSELLVFDNMFVYGIELIIGVHIEVNTASTYRIARRLSRPIKDALQRTITERGFVANHDRMTTSIRHALSCGLDQWQGQLALGGVLSILTFGRSQCTNDSALCSSGYIVSI